MGGEELVRHCGGHGRPLERPRHPGGVYGVRRFDGLQRRLAIATNILANRLERLTAQGVLERVPPSSSPSATSTG